MRFTKILALILACVILLCAFCACEEKELDAKKLEAEAAVKLLDNPYKLTTGMAISYSCEDEKVNEALKNNKIDSSMSMYVDGTNFKITAGMDGYDVEYIFVGNTVYMDLMGAKVKSEIEKEDIADIVGAGASGIEKMSSSGFATVKAEKNDEGKFVISCKGLEGEPNELINSLIDDIGSIGDEKMSVDLDKGAIEYIAVIGKDGRYESMMIKLNMVTSINGEKLDIDAEITMSFDYEKAIEVKVPEDADNYRDMGDLGDVFD